MWLKKNKLLKPGKMYKVLTVRNLTTIASKPLTINDVIPAGHKLVTLNEVYLERTINTLVSLYSVYEPIGIYSGLSKKDAYAMFGNWIKGIYHEGISTILVDNEENVNSITITEDGNMALARVKNSFPTNPANRAIYHIGLLKAFNFGYMTNYYRKKGLTNNKNLYISIGCVHPRLRGRNTSLISLYASLIEAKRKGYTRAFIHCNNLISARTIPQNLLVRKVEYDQMNFKELTGKDLFPFKGINDWFSNRVNTDRVKQGKSLISDAAKYSMLFEGPIETYVENCRKILNI